MSVISPVCVLPPEAVANADAWPPGVIVEVAELRLMMSHWYLVLADPPEAPLATGDRSQNTSAANEIANAGNLSLFISLSLRFSRPLRVHVQRLTLPGDSAAAVQPNELGRCLSSRMTLEVELELNWADSRLASEQRPRARAYAWACVDRSVVP